MSLTTFYTKQSFLFFIFIFFLITDVFLAVFIYLSSPKIIVQDNTGRNVTYQKSELFEKYLHEWNVLNNSSHVKLLPQKQFLAEEVILILVPSELNLPTYLVRDTSTSPPTTLYSIEESLKNKTWYIRVYIKPNTTIPYYYENNLLWLTLYSLYKTSHSNLEDVQIAEKIQPYYNYLVNNKKNYVFSKYDN